MLNRGWKGVDLAAAAQVTPTSVSRYLAAKAEPRSAELLRMAQALGVSMEWLLAGIETSQRAPSSEGKSQIQLKQAVTSAERLASRLREAEAELETLRQILS